MPGAMRHCKWVVQVAARMHSVFPCVPLYLTYAVPCHACDQLCAKDICSYS